MTWDRGACSLSGPNSTLLAVGHTVLLARGPSAGCATALLPAGGGTFSPPGLFLSLKHRASTVARTGHCPQANSVMPTFLPGLWPDAANGALPGGGLAWGPRRPTQPHWASASSQPTAVAYRPLPHVATYFSSFTSHNSHAAEANLFTPAARQ